MENSAINPDIRPCDTAIEQDLRALSAQLLMAGDGTGVAPLNPEVLLQYFINDTNELLNATPKTLPGVISKFKQRLTENHHEKLKPLYRIPICFVSEKLHLTQVINNLQQIISSSLNGTHHTSLVMNEQIDYARDYIEGQNNMLEDVIAMDEPPEKIGFQFEGNSVFVLNGTRDRIFRYWYQNRERHIELGYSNREIAKEMNVELGVTVDYAAKIISQINRWFENGTGITWLNGEYIQRTQMYFKYRGYNLQLNFCNQPPTPLQIITLGQQLHVSTKQQTEE